MSDDTLSPEQREFLAEMRRREAERVKEAKKAFAVPADFDGLGSFGADNPAVHENFRNQPVAAEQPEAESEES